MSFLFSVGQQLLNRHMQQITQLVFSTELPLRHAALQFFDAAVRLNSCHPSIFHLPLITLTGDQKLNQESEILGLLAKVLTANNIPKFAEIIQAGHRFSKLHPAANSQVLPHFYTFFRFLYLKKLKPCRQAFLKALLTLDFSGRKGLHDVSFLPRNKYEL